MLAGGLGVKSIMRGLQKNDCQSSAQSIQNNFSWRNPLYLCLLFGLLPLFTLQQRVSFSVCQKNLSAGSAVTATGSGLY